jgi:hypothetical protein
VYRFACPAGQDGKDAFYSVRAVDVRIGCLEMLKVLDDDQRVSYSVRASFQYLQVRERGTGAEADADEPCRTLNPQVKFSGQR